MVVTLIIVAVLAVWIGFIIGRMVKNKKNNKNSGGGCNGNCSNCSGCR